MEAQTSYGRDLPHLLLEVDTSAEITTNVSTMLLSQVWRFIQLSTDRLHIYFKWQSDNFLLLQIWVPNNDVLALAMNLKIVMVCEMKCPLT